MIYLDTSAAYTLLSRESGVEDVEALFASGEELLSSRLLEVELHATVDRRGGSHDDVGRILERVALDAIDGEVTTKAVELRSGLRTLDALHLATAVLYGEQVTGMCTYGRELASAAQRRGIPPWTRDQP